MTDNKFANAFAGASNSTETENGALTNRTSLSSVVDLFANGGALRRQSEEAISKEILKAFLENPTYALRTLFYLRDVRGGQGERRTFRVGLKLLAQEDPDRLAANLNHVAEFGRWDDLLSLIGTKLEHNVLGMIKNRLQQDLAEAHKENGQISLLAKWLPSENASSKETVRLAKKVRAFLELSAKDYRKTLSFLRNKIAIVESKMCAKEFGAIEYSHVPSVASLKYRKAFGKRDTERYGAYLKAVAEGKTKINASTLYPYDIVREVVSQVGKDDTLELQWKALPNYLEDTNATALVVADVSGSMGSLHLKGANGPSPMQVCIGLTLYTAERLRGPFQDMFLTFSGKSRAEKLRGATLREKIHNLSQAHWEMNTNIQSAFDEILRIAKEGNCSQEDLPQNLIIISDMQFDNCVNSGGQQVRNFDAARAKFEAAGYQLPAVTFWNCSARLNQVPVTKAETGVLLASGASPSTLKAVLNRKAQTPEELVLEVLDSPRYSVIN